MIMQKMWVQSAPIPKAFENSANELANNSKQDTSEYVYTYT